MKYIANITDPEWDLTIEQEYIPPNQLVCDYLCAKSLLTKYDETIEPRPAKKVYLYETGKSYPANLLILKDSIFYVSNVVTSETWVLSEYTPK